MFGLFGKKPSNQKTKTKQSPFQNKQASQQKLNKTRKFMMTQIQIAISRSISYKTIAIKMSNFYVQSSKIILNKTFEIIQINSPENGFHFFFKSTANKITFFTTPQFKLQNKFFIQQPQSFCIALIAARYAIQDFFIASVKETIQKSFQAMPLSPSLLIYTAASYFILNGYHTLTNLSKQTKQNTIIKSFWFQDSQNYVTDNFGIKMPFPIAFGYKFQKQPINSAIQSKKKTILQNSKQVQNKVKSVMKFCLQNRVNLTDFLNIIKENKQTIDSKKIRQLQKKNNKQRQQISVLVKELIQQATKLHQVIGYLSPNKQKLNTYIQTQYSFVQKIGTQLINAQIQQKQLNFFDKIPKVSVFQLLKSKVNSSLEYTNFVQYLVKYIQQSTSQQIGILQIENDMSNKILLKQFIIFLSSFNQYVVSTLSDLNGFYASQKQIMTQSDPKKITSIVTQYANKYEASNYGKIISSDIKKIKGAVKNISQYFFQNRLQLSQFDDQTYFSLVNQLNSIKTKLQKMSTFQISRMKSFFQLIMSKIYLSKIQWQLSESLAQLSQSITQLSNSIFHISQIIQQIKKIKNQSQKISQSSQRTFQNTKKIVQIVYQLKQDNERSDKQINQLKKQIQKNNNNISLVLAEQKGLQQFKDVIKNGYSPVGFQSIYDLTMRKIDQSIQKQKKSVQLKTSKANPVIGIQKVYGDTMASINAKIKKQMKQTQLKILNMPNFAQSIASQTFKKIDQNLKKQSQSVRKKISSHNTSMGMQKIYDLTVNKINQTVKQQKKDLQTKISNIKTSDVGIMSIYNQIVKQYDSRIKNQTQNVRGQLKRSAPSVGIQDLYGQIIQKINQNKEKQINKIKDKMQKQTDMGLQNMYDNTIKRIKTLKNKQLQNIASKIQKQDIGFEDIYQQTKKHTLKAQTNYFQKIKQNKAISDSLQQITQKQKQNILQKLKTINNSIIFEPVKWDNWAKFDQIQQQKFKLSEYQIKIRDLFAALQSGQFNQQKFKQLVKLIKDIKQTQNKYIVMQKSKDLSQAVQKFSLKLQLVQKQISKRPVKIQKYIANNQKTYFQQTNPDYYASINGLKKIGEQKAAKTQLEKKLVVILKQQNKMLRLAIQSLYNYFLTIINKQSQFYARFLSSLRDSIDNKQLLQTNIKLFIDDAKNSYQKIVKHIIGRLWEGKQYKVAKKDIDEVLQKRRVHYGMDQITKIRQGMKKII